MHWDITQIILDGLTFEGLKRFVLAAIMTGAGQVILTYVFKKLKSRREIIAFWGGSLVLFLTLIAVVGNQAQRPNLVASIQQGLSGSGQGDREIITVLALNIINTGTMQSIIKNWRVHAEVGGLKYDAAFAQMPPTFTFKDIPRVTLNQPTSITYSNQDNLIEKSLTPIQVGALMPGILFVVFQNVDRSVFNGQIVYTVTFEDVLSRVYTASVRSTGQIAQVGLVPGLKNEMSCPIPPEGLPKVGSDLLENLKKK